MMTIAGLGGSLGNFAASLREMFQARAMPESGSPAAREADGEPFADEWGAHPARDASSTTTLAGMSCADHLAVLASALQSRVAMYSLYTVARGALEAAAQGCYLTEAGIEPLERVRRNMNLDLNALHEDTWMLRKVDGAEAAKRIRCHTGRAAIIARSAGQFGLRFTPASGPVQAYLGDNKPPRMMEMIVGCADPGRCAVEGPQLRRAYQRLSSVAHGLWHGHQLLLARTESPIPGQVNLELRLTPGRIAEHLLVAPMVAAELVRRACAYRGWGGPLTTPMATMLTQWQRTAGTA